MEIRTRATRKTAKYRAIETKTTSLRGGYWISSVPGSGPTEGPSTSFPKATTGDLGSFSELMALLVGMIVQSIAVAGAY